jgi:hypothetical protein
MSNLIRELLPSRSTLFFEKIDMDHSTGSKIAMWKTSNQGQIQVAVVRNPLDIAISDCVMTAMNDISKNGEQTEKNLLTNDVHFARKVALILKQTERYFDALSENSDSSHILYRFEDTTDPEKRKLVVKDILEKAGHQFNEIDYEEADELIDINTTYNVNHIVVNPANRNEIYNQVRARFEEMSDSISLTAVNAKYSLALQRCVNI